MDVGACVLNPLQIALERTEWTVMCQTSWYRLVADVEQTPMQPEKNGFLEIGRTCVGMVLLEWSCAPKVPCYSVSRVTTVVAVFY